MDEGKDDGSECRKEGKKEEQGGKDKMKDYQKVQSSRQNTGSQEAT